MYLCQWVRTIWRPKWWRDEVWCLVIEQIDRLLCTVSRCPISLEGEVIREFFDVGQEFLDEEYFAVILTVDFHTSIDKMKISVPQGRHTRRNHQRSIYWMLVDSVTIGWVRCSFEHQLERKREHFEYYLVLPRWKVFRQWTRLSFPFQLGIVLEVFDTTNTLLLIVFR